MDELLQRFLYFDVISYTCPKQDVGVTNLR